MNEAAVACVELTNRRVCYHDPAGGWTVEDLDGHTLSGGQWRIRWLSHRDGITLVADVFPTLDAAVEAALSV